MPKKPQGETRYSPEIKGYVGRIREGGKRTAWLPLGTDDKVIAKEKCAAWAQGGPAPVERGKETFRAAAERIMKRQEESGFKGAASRRHRIRAFALPVIGHLQVSALEPGHIHSVLRSTSACRLELVEEVAKHGAPAVGASRGLDVRTLERWHQGDKAEGFLFDTVSHLRSDLSRILGELVKEHELKQNPASDIELPEELCIDERERMVLTDEEYVRYQRRGFDGDVEMIALLSRNYAGGRPSDWFAWLWGDINFHTWTAYVRRPKTTKDGENKKRSRRKRRSTLAYERIELVIPEPVRGPLWAWYVRAGKPAADRPVFPVQRGARVGQKKRGTQSLAARFRQTVWDERIHRWMTDKPGFAEATGDALKAFDRLQTDTETTRALDFYSNRRAFIGAMARAGVNAQTALLAAGQSSMEVQQRYQPRQTIELPAGVQPGVPQQAPISPPAAPAPDAVAQLAAALAALVRGSQGGIDPALGSNGAPSLGQTQAQVPEFVQRAHLGSNQGPLAPEAGSDHLGSSKDPQLAEGVGALVSPSNGVVTQGLGHSIALLQQAAAQAVAEGNWALADQLRAMLTPPPGVASLDEARAKRKR